MGSDAQGPGFQGWSTRQIRRNIDREIERAEDSEGRGRRKALESVKALVHLGAAVSDEQRDRLLHGFEADGLLVVAADRSLDASALADLMATPTDPMRYAARLDALLRHPATTRETVRELARRAVDDDAVRGLLTATDLRRSPAWARQVWLTVAPATEVAEHGDDLAGMVLDLRPLPRMLLRRQLAWHPETVGHPRMTFALRERRVAADPVIREAVLGQDDPHLHQAAVDGAPDAAGTDRLLDRIAEQDLRAVLKRVVAGLPLSGISRPLAAALLSHIAERDRPRLYGALSKVPWVERAVQTEIAEPHLPLHVSRRGPR